MTESTWGRTMLGAVSKSQVLGPEEGSPLYSKHRRIVDLVCHCGERVGMVRDEPEQPWLTAWYPTAMVRESSEGEPFYGVQGGIIPPPDEDVVLRCFKHGQGVVNGAEITSAIVRYRQRGRPVRLVVIAPT
jgi:hypothetical protein